MTVSPLYCLLESLPPTTIAALAATRVETDRTPVFMIAVPSRERERIEEALHGVLSFASVDDGQEFSIVIHETHLEALQALATKIQVEGPFHFVRLDVSLPWTTVGYGAAIFAALAEADISAGMLSGFSTDCLLIPSAKLSAAVRTLSLLFDQAPEMQPGA